MSKIKKLLAGLFTFTLMSALCVICAEAGILEDYDYSYLDDGTVEIIGYTGTDTDLVIPSEIDGFTVTRIGDSAFAFNSSVSTVTIPDTVTSIGKEAFMYCDFTSVTIPESVTKIESNAFCMCEFLTSVKIPESVTQIELGAFMLCKKLDTVTIPDSVTSIDLFAFASCYALKSISIPDSVTSIGYSAFQKTGLTNVDISANVTAIGDYAFADCSALAVINVSEENKHYTSVDGVLFNKDKTVLITYPRGKSTTECVVPDGVTCIGTGAFCNFTSFTSITFPDGLETIENGAFSNCNSVITLKFPDTLTYIGDKAFENCTTLKFITVPASVSYIGVDAFAETAWLEKQNDGPVYAGKNLYAYKGEMPFFESIEVKEGTLSITENAFSGYTSLRSIRIPDTVKRIGKNAFYDCEWLYSVRMTSNITVIEDGTFRYCNNLSKIVIPDGVTSIGDNAFDSCIEVTELTIPDSVTGIGKEAFRNCKKITSVVIPDSVTLIDDYAFRMCTLLESVTIPDSVKYVGEDAFDATAWDNNQADGVVYTGKVAYWYKGALPDNGIVEIKDGTVAITAGAFSYEELKGVTIPGSVSVIGNKAFYNCDYLSSVVLPQGVVSIGDSAFETCSELMSVTIPESVTSIGTNAFLDCPSAMVIKGYTDTCAESYAEENGIKFEALPEVLNDVTGFKIAGRAGDALRLSWDKVSRADGYILQKYDGSKWVRIAKITDSATTTYRVAGLTPSTTYKFRICAYRMTGTSTAVYSSYVNVTGTTNPSVVADFRLGARVSDAIRLNWTKNTSADGYIIEKYDGSKWVRVTKITDNATTTYRVAGLTASKTYKFRIRAYNMVGSVALYGSYSNITATTIPSPVAGLKIGGKASDALRLNWDKNDSADGYIIEMYDGTNWVRITKITTNATLTYRKSGLESGTTYKFRVRAYNMVGSTALYSAYAYVNGTTN